MVRKQKATNKNFVSNSNQIWWLSLGASFVTLYFNSKLQDPFNSPKMWALIAISSWLLGFIVLDFKNNVRDKNSRNLIVLLTIFLAAGIFAAFNTDVLYVAFLGETQRRNGFVSYFGLVILMLAATFYVRLDGIKRINYVALFTGFVLAVYGLMQISGIDFIKWNNPYNAIISTVGNPNFAGAIMAMMAAIAFGPVLNNGFNKIFRSLSLILVFTLLYTIYLSEARQGLISLAIGVGFYLLVWIYQKSKILGHVFAGIGAIVGTLSVLGMLQIGPLTSLLYKGSVSVRGYYWRAGFEMFMDNPITGVGLDRYGANFKQYREVEYPLTYGFNITSSNAHDLPIQLFATGGIFFGTSYLLLVGFIFYRGIVAIKSNIGNNQLLVTSIFSAWLAYQAQSIISIDNIGISVWGWLLGGAVVGLSASTASNSEKLIQNNNKISSTKLAQPIVSMSFVIAAIVFISILYKGENNMYETRQRYNPQVAENRQPLFEYATKTINTNLVDPNYRVMSAAYLVATGFTTEGLTELENVASYDPRNLDNLNYLADYNQQLGKLEESNKYRLIIADQDPWNSRNFLQLGRNFKSLGNYTEMSKMLAKINSYDLVSEEAKAANVELIQP
jgi:O-antigen ligase